jgi:RimJ/RimL family protein N-acetyltransferase
MLGAENTLRIETDRLVIKPIDEADLGAFHTIAQRREIALMLASVPHPLSLEAARKWVADRAYRGRPGFAAGIYLRDKMLVGCIGLVNQPPTVNYFFGPDHWGRGYATEALIVFLDWCAEKFGLTEIKAGALHDNVGSHRVLEKAGFRLTHVVRHRPPIRPKPDRLLMFWKGFGAPEPLTIGTERLYLHPITAGHAARLSELGNDPPVARMLTFVKLPFTPERAKSWIEQVADAPDECRLAITTLEGHLLGAIALSVGETSATFTGWIGREWWRKGYGLEAARGLVELTFSRYPTIDQIGCSVMHDNPAAIRIMERLGFRLAGEGHVNSPARDVVTRELHLSLVKLQLGRAI